MISSTTGISDDAHASSYPRTGKRGVPQQFPRRLSEMLESEARLAAIDPHHQSIISWSTSGKAFRIEDVSLFSSHILPKYFRTSKFSSFQRNLNLYGFCKVRRGPDTDMYAHPAFVRGQSETLSQLRKCKSSGAKNPISAAMSAPTKASFGHIQNSSASRVTPPTNARVSRAVSPLPIGTIDNGFRHIEPKPCVRVNVVKPSVVKHPLWHHSPTEITTAPTPISPGGFDSGRLDLLTLALKSIAERDASMGGMNATAIETA